MRLGGASVAECSASAACAASASSHPRLRGLVPVCLVALASLGTVARASAEDAAEPAAAPEPAAGAREPAGALAPEPDARPESDHDAEAQSGPPRPVPALGGSPPPPPPPAAAPARPRGPTGWKSKPPSAATPVGPPPAHPNEVTIRLLVQPPGIAHVLWGMKDLGVAPLDLVRPRGSGPLDLTLRAAGYLTFHTRAFTERDDKIAIRMVLSSEAARFPGFAGTEGSGAPATAPTTTATPSSDHPRGRASGAR